ncbi:MAG: carbon-nitrogen hydrolase family protein [Pseudomonas sp.]|uniref:carbon-nitrogen hydrolase family protein n=1 Tax=Pseudomonas sp. TaxID=306 RepID=UPI0030F24DDA
MRLALWQTQGHPGDIAANLADLAVQARAAAAAGAELLLCSELWLGGYNLRAQPAEAADGPSAQRISELAQEHGIAICYGYAESHESGGKPYNAAQVISANGQRLSNYRKTHLFGAFERTLFTPGDRLQAPFKCGDWSIGLLICFDVELPENVRKLTLQGAELLLIPTALTPEYRAVPDLIVPARAVENQLFVAYCNHSGVEAGLAFLGGSCVAAPDGSKLASAANGEALLIVDLDHGQRAALESTFPYLAGRRPEIYT